MENWNELITKMEISLAERVKNEGNVISRKTKVLAELLKSAKKRFKAEKKFCKIEAEYNKQLAEGGARNERLEESLKWLKETM